MPADGINSVFLASVYCVPVCLCVWAVEQILWTLVILLWTFLNWIESERYAFVCVFDPSYYRPLEGVLSIHFSIVTVSNKKLNAVNAFEICQFFLLSLHFTTIVRSWLQLIVRREIRTMTNDQIDRKKVTRRIVATDESITFFRWRNWKIEKKVVLKLIEVRIKENKK